MDQESKCPNCGARSPQADDLRFCGRCGQNNTRARLETRAVLLDTLQNFVGWDTALIRTLRGLAFHPANLVLDYVNGRRRSFVHPARFCLLSLGLWYLAMHFANLDALASTGISIHPSGSTDDGRDLAFEVRAFLARNLELLQFLALPLLAMILRGLFRRSGRNLAECMVLVLYLVGFRYLVAAAFVPLELLVSGTQEVVRVVFGPVWLAWAARGFFQTTTWSAIWRAAVGVILHVIATVVFFGLVAIPWVLLT